MDIKIRQINRILENLLQEEIDNININYKISTLNYYEASYINHKEIITCFPNESKKDMFSNSDHNSKNKTVHQIINMNIVLNLYERILMNQIKSSNKFHIESQQNSQVQD